MSDQEENKLWGLLGKLHADRCVLAHIHEFDPKEVGFSLEPSPETVEELRQLDIEIAQAERRLFDFRFI